MDFSQETLLAAGRRFEQVNGAPPRELEDGWVDDAGLTDVDPDELAAWIMKSIDDSNNDDQECRRRAYWALGYKYDAKLIPYFIVRLKVEVQRDVEAAYHILIALDNLDEEPFGNRDSHGTDDHDLNRLDAMAYLDGRKISK
ncbi:MAG: hypothetical protein GXP30_07120 [Verrucomicrobia bacterium]|nr:hypothetical protein [Verrucomicrobiota bacterium]